MVPGFKVTTGNWNLTFAKYPEQCYGSNTQKKAALKTNEFINYMPIQLPLLQPEDNQPLLLQVVDFLQVKCQIL